VPPKIAKQKKVLAKSPVSLPPEILQLNKRLEKLENAAKKNTGAESEPLLQVCVFGTPFNGRLLVKQQQDEEFVKRLELLQQQLKLYNGWQEVRSLC
jgi:hypothetical protein